MANLTTALSQLSSFFEENGINPEMVEIRITGANSETQWKIWDSFRDALAILYFSRRSLTLRDFRFMGMRFSLSYYSFRSDDMVDYGVSG